MIERIAGVDEAGRGPLCGPVCAAAVILNPDNTPKGIADSKKLSARKRETLAEAIKSEAVSWAIAWASVAEIDQLNILGASMLAMRRAIDALPTRPDMVLIDGNRLPSDLEMPAQAIVKGDALVSAIAAASILAKTARDEEMLRLHAIYPDFGLDRHMGYPTRLHTEVLARLGPTPCHRQSFAPVRAAFANGVRDVARDMPALQRGGRSSPGG